MTGIPNETTQKPEENKPVSEPVKTETTAAPVQPRQTPAYQQPVQPAPQPAAAPVNNAQAKTADTSPDQTRMLGLIQGQLQALNQNITALTQTVNEGKNVDFRSVFAKIDSARMSIENMICSAASQPAPQPAEPSEDEKQLMSLLQSIVEKQDRNDRQLAQTLRENATFQIQVRQGMQKDLDALREQMNGEQFNPLLKEIASVYVEYQTLLEDESISDRSRKNLQALFEQLEDMLSDYDAQVCKSEIGSVRQTRTCKIIEKIPTGEEAKHNTIAASRKPGVTRGRTVLYPEFVDVYVYDPSLAQNEAAAEEEPAAQADEPAAVQPTESMEPAAPEAPAPETTEETQTTDQTAPNNNLGGIES